MTQNLSPSSLLAFSRWIRQQRRRFGFTQTELARKVNCSASTIRKLEKGIRHPSTQLAVLIADALHIPAQEREHFLRLALDEAPLISTNNGLTGNQFILPHPPTALIGRGTDTENVQKMFDHTNIRLVTILGAPGVGKTRLAIQVAANLARASSHPFPDGVCYASLAPIRDHNLVGQTLINALGAPLLANQTPAQCLVAFLKTKSLLLVLDNFEHILSATALIAELLLSAPQLKILVTSRASLRLTGEHEYVLRPLALPSLNPLPTPAQLLETPAVALFGSFVQAVNPQFALTAENAAAIAQICVRLDGLPLAIELAAARSRLLPPTMLLQRLVNGNGAQQIPNGSNGFAGKRLALLTEGARDLAERHQTLRSAIAWSYHLLTPPVQTLFARLAIFAGDYTIEAAEAICDATLDKLEALLTHSLLRTEMVVGEDGAQLEVRFVMLETIREFAWECLANSGELSAIQQCHAEYYLHLAEQLDWVYHPTDSTRLPILKRLERDYANLHQALTWSQTDNTDVLLALQLAEHLFPFWYMSARHDEARHWLRGALAKDTQLTADGMEPLSGENPSFALREIRARTLCKLAVLSNRAEEQKRLQILLTKCRAAEQHNGDPLILWRLLLGLFMLQTRTEPARESEALEKELLANAQAVENSRCLGWTLYGISYLARRQGKLDKARVTGMESVSHLRASQDMLHLTLSLHNLARVRHAQGEYAQGEYAQAQTDWLDALTQAQQAYDLHGTILSLDGLACLLGAQGHYEQALCLFGAVDEFCNNYHITIDLADRVGYEATIHNAQAQLSKEAFATAWQAGRTMPLSQVIAQTLAQVNEA